MPLSGLILVYPYGSLVINGDKSMIVKSKKFKLSDDTYLIVENKLGLGEITLEEPITIPVSDFNKYYSQHKIPEKHRLEWWKDYDKLYGYRVINILKYKKPILLTYKSGPQVIVHNYQPKKIYIGTSGFTKSKLIDKYNKLNSVEINHTFYKYPSQTLINHISKSNLVYSIKVNKLITHFKQLKNVDKDWTNFYEAFTSVQNKIKCYLFQFSYKFLYNESNLSKLSEFINKHTPQEHQYLVFEFRDTNWYSNIPNLPDHVLFCSIDLPPNEDNKRIMYWVHNDVVYLRLHGPTDWYDGEYTYEDLNELYETICKTQGKQYFIYFNNDKHDGAMINALRFVKKFNKTNLLG